MKNRLNPCFVGKCSTRYGYKASLALMYQYGLNPCFVGKCSTSEHGQEVNEPYVSMS